MRMFNLILILLSLFCVQVMAKTPKEKFILHTVDLNGEIKGEHFTIEVKLSATIKDKKVKLPIALGNIVLLKEDNIYSKWVTLKYDYRTKTYSLNFKKTGNFEYKAIFAAKPSSVGGTYWKSVYFDVPLSGVKKLKVLCDKKDLEVKFPDAVRLKRSIEKEKLKVTAIIGKNNAYHVQWKPKVDELEAKLVASSEVNTIVRVSVGTLQEDVLLSYDITQGKLKELFINIPNELNVTQVKGKNIRDWIIKKGNANQKKLHVIFSTPQTRKYYLQIIADMTLKTMPVKLALPVISNVDGVRSSGFISVGTQSALHLLIDQTSGVSQVDSAAFPRMRLASGKKRFIPRKKVFFYIHSSSNYSMNLVIKDIVPSYDVTNRATITIKEDNFIVDEQLQVDVRDAPIQMIQVEIPKGYAVADVTGSQVNSQNFILHENKEKSLFNILEIPFMKPIIGRVLINIRLETGKAPFKNKQIFSGSKVLGAGSERGYIVIAGGKGVLLQQPVGKELREVHTGSLPLKIRDAQFAFRFREAKWSIELEVQKKVAGISSESLHLLSFSDGVCYGSVITSYSITGAPVDELQFRISDRLETVEFIGKDVVRWENKDGLWTVKLRRKVIGDYNLGVSFTQKYSDDKDVVIGGVQCENDSTQSGYIIMASHSNLKISSALKEADNDNQKLIEIPIDEIPTSYRLMINAPILKSYKYVYKEHQAIVKLTSLEKGDLIDGIVEVMSLVTNVMVRDGGEAEAVTVVRYKAKNINGQFLSLTLPAGATIWTTEFVRLVNGVEKITRVTASQVGNVIKIPLKRKRNPNDPITIAIQYGQSFGQMGDSLDLKLLAPKSKMLTTFSSWIVKVPEGWGLVAKNEGNMVSDKKVVRTGSFFAFISRVGNGWQYGLKRYLKMDAIFFMNLAFLGILIFMFLIKREYLPFGFLIGLMVNLFIIGLKACQYLNRFDPLAELKYYTELKFTRVLNIASQDPLELSARVIPEWQQFISYPFAIGGFIFSIICLIVAVKIKTLRPVFLSAFIVGLMFVGVRSAATENILIHVVSWGIPVGLLIFICIRFLRRVANTNGANLAAVAVCLLLFFGPPASIEAKSKKAKKIKVKKSSPKSDLQMMEKINYVISVEKDTVAVTLTMDVDVNKPCQLPFITNKAILLTKRTIDKTSKIIKNNSAYLLDLKKKGKQSFTINFLIPLKILKKKNIQYFSISSPLSMTNEVTVSIPKIGLEVISKDAFQMNKEEKDGATIVKSIFSPGSSIQFMWTPRARKTKLEKTVFYSGIVGLSCFDSGVIENAFQMEYQIAQGEMSKTTIKIPANMTVSDVKGSFIGGWRFDNENKNLEVRFLKPISGQYQYVIYTQIPQKTIPYDVTIKVPTIIDSSRQRSIIGVVTTKTVSLQIIKSSSKMNISDFKNKIHEHRVSFSALQSKSGNKIRHAFRTTSVGQSLVIKAKEVLPEIRTFENASFSISDDRLVYNGEFKLIISKAGLFSAALQLPRNYDIDNISGHSVSHWDDVDNGKFREVQIHFKSKLLGEVPLKITLSKPQSELPKKIDLPKILYKGTKKHNGSLRISYSRGTRLSVGKLMGVSEFNPGRFGVSNNRSMTYKLLRADWQLELIPEVVKARVILDFLHVAKISEGLVKHTHYLRLLPHNAGVKTFNVKIPKNALGLLITGPQMANKKETAKNSGEWKIELDRKWFDRAYPLQIKYETQFISEKGSSKIEPVEVMGIDLAKGDIAVFSADRIELTEDSISKDIQKSEARTISRKFGTGDLSAAAFCYKSNRQSYDMSFSLLRHKVAHLLEADASSTKIDSVVNRSGDSVTRVLMNIKVGSKRNLEVQLPQGSKLLSILVNGKFVSPFYKQSGSNKVILIPLAQSSSNELPVDLEFIYTSTRIGSDDMRHSFQGPKFDLPLKNIEWRFFLPKDWDYSEFEGTMLSNEREPMYYDVAIYDANIYDGLIYENAKENYTKTIAFQKEAKGWADTGKQKQAKDAFRLALNFSYSDKALNEDARVQLHRLEEEQAIIGLINRRNIINKNNDISSDDSLDTINQGEYLPSDAQRLQGSLNDVDNDNISNICRKLIEMQASASENDIHLKVNMPLRGKILRFHRSLQVNKNADMQVSFRTHPAFPEKTQNEMISLAVVMIVLTGIIGIVPALINKILNSISAKSQREEVVYEASDEVEETEEVEEEKPVEEEKSKELPPIGEDPDNKKDEE
ncbi:MAG: hypothetical protein COA79_20120 [Planctomycetota bacterium]|nr:MAG: hypothetical protein COA79_20120 [Planctomycetota bacterium]